MGEFGQALRKEREARGIALESITKVTKIGNRHLRALEDEQFGELPGGVFNKGIVRGYARVVGLDEEEWVARYLSAYRASGRAIEDEHDWAQFAENAGKSRRASQGERPDMRLRWTGIAILLLLLAALSWFVFDYIHQKTLADQTGSAELDPAIFALRPSSDTLIKAACDQANSPLRRRDNLAGTR